MIRSTLLLHRHVLACAFLLHTEEGTMHSAVSLLLLVYKSAVTGGSVSSNLTKQNWVGPHKQVLTKPKERIESVYFGSVGPVQMFASQCTPCSTTPSTASYVVSGLQHTFSYLDQLSLCLPDYLLVHMCYIIMHTILSGYKVGLVTSMFSACSMRLGGCNRDENFWIRSVVNLKLSWLIAREVADRRSARMVYHSHLYHCSLFS